MQGDVDIRFVCNLISRTMIYLGKKIFPKYNNLFVLDHYIIIMNLSYKTVFFLFLLNIVCFAIAIGMDYYDQKIDKMSIHLILFCIIFTIGYILATKHHTNEEGISISYT